MTIRNNNTEANIALETVPELFGRSGITLKHTKSYLNRKNVSLNIDPYTNNNITIENIYNILQTNLPFFCVSDRRTKKIHNAVIGRWVCQKNFKAFK